MSEDSRLAIVGIVVEDLESSGKLNDLICDAKDHIVARMGIPYKERGLSVISLIVDGNNNEISSFTGKVGRLRGVTVKSMITKSKN